MSAQVVLRLLDNNDIALIMKSNIQIKCHGNRSILNRVINDIFSTLIDKLEIIKTVVFYF